MPERDYNECILMRSYGYIHGEYAYILLVDVYIGVYGWLWWINCVQYVNICIYIFKCIYSDICCAYFICDTYIYIYIFPYIGLWWWTNHQYTMLFPGDSFMDVVNGAIMLVKQCHKPSPSHNHFYRWYIYQSESWVVKMVLFYPHYTLWSTNIAIEHGHL